MLNVAVPSAVVLNVVAPDVAAAVVLSKFGEKFIFPRICFRLKVQLRSQKPFYTLISY
jgi:hypothetical protein